MPTITIPAKMSGTGSIHDLASQHFDREIKMPKTAKYAVVLIAYYGDIHTTHRTWDAALAESRKQSRAGFENVILDSDGYITEPDRNDKPVTCGEPYDVTA